MAARARKVSLAMRPQPLASSFRRRRTLTVWSARLPRTRPRSRPSSIRALPVVALPGYSRPLVKVSDYLALVERSTFDERTRVR
jgi:hypothetical protein